MMREVKREVDNKKGIINIVWRPSPLLLSLNFNTANLPF